MAIFNSISEIVNAIANFDSVADFDKEPFISVHSYTGGYITNWDTITEDGPNAKEGNHFLTLPEYIIYGIQDHIAQEGMTMLIYIPLTLEALDFRITTIMEILLIPVTYIITFNQGLMRITISHIFTNNINHGESD